MTVRNGLQYRERSNFSRKNASAISAMHLSDQQRAQFERDGYLCPIRVLDDGEVARFLISYLEYSADNQSRLDELPANQKYKVLSETHFVLPWVYEIVTHPLVLDAVEGLLGPNLLAWNSNWFTKMPGEKSFVSWHQDGTYWKLSPPTVVTAWVALSPSAPSNGCMRVMPGTHTRSMLPQRETYIPDNALSRGQEIAVEVDEQKAVDLSLRPGEMSLHHIWIIHGSNANTSKDMPRIGIAIRYTRPEVVQESPTKPLAMLARGEDKFGNFDLQPPPINANSHELQSRHQEIVDHARGSLMSDAKRK
jgi:non-haem Fe2+, alpha-ketoglutarate-dependent halogenase